MLIIEGTDLVGKTTLAKKLERELAGDGYVYQHISGNPPDAFDRVSGYLDLAARRTVRDRFHMSEVAYDYATLRRGGKPLLTPEKYRIVDGALRMMGAVTVVVLCPEDILRDRFIDRQDRHEMYDVKIILRANEAFNSLRCSAPRSIPPLDTFQVDVDYVIDCNRGHPFPDNDDIRRILELYQFRQEQVAL